MNYSNSQRAGVILYLTALLFGGYITTDKSASKEDILTPGGIVVTPPPATQEPETDLNDAPSAGTDYIVNTNTDKFHYPDCRSVKQMKESNKWYYTGTRDDLIAQGYDPCGNCHP